MVTRNLEPLKKQFDIVLTIIAGVFLGTAAGINWWTQGYGETAEYFSIWKTVDCDSGVCFLSVLNSAGWIYFVRLMIIVGLSVLVLSLITQILYILKPMNGFRIASLVFSGVAGLTLGVTGFTITGFFHSISKKYNTATERLTFDQDALTYQTLPLGFIFLSAFIITIVGVFILTNTEPKKRERKSACQIIVTTRKGGIEFEPS